MPKIADVAIFSKVPSAGEIADAYETYAVAVGSPGPVELSKCALCVGTPDITPTNTSAERDGIAFREAGTVEVAGYAGAVGLAEIAACKVPRTVRTFTISPIACA